MKGGICSRGGGTWLHTQPANHTSPEIARLLTPPETGSTTAPDIYPYFNFEIAISLR